MVLPKNKSIRWLKGWGRVSCDMSRAVISEREIVKNIKQELFWLAYLPPDCIKYIMDLNGLEYGFDDNDKFMIRPNTLYGEWLMLSNVLIEMNENNLIKCNANCRMLNGHSNMKECCNPVIIMLNNNGDTDLMGDYYGDRWYDFCDREKRKKTDCYLRMSKKDNRKLLIKWLFYYCGCSHSITGDYCRTENTNNSWQSGSDINSEWDFIYQYHVLNNTKLMTDVYENIDDPTIVDRFARNVNLLLHTGCVRRVDGSERKYCVVAKDRKRICVKKDWPVLMTYKTKMGSQEIKYPLSLSTGWGFNNIDKYDEHTKFYSPECKNIMC